MTEVGAVARFYGRWARLYDLVARRTPGIAPLRARVAAVLDLDADDTVAEMGCGTGANVPYLREEVGSEGRVIGVDLTPGMLERLRVRADRERWTNVHPVLGDAARPPVAGGVDGVVATFVVGMLDDPAGAVEEWCDRLAPGGRLALLDATRSTHPLVRPANAAFRAFVTLTAPPTARVRYDEPPVDALERRVNAARDALADRTTVVADETYAGGFLRLSAGRIR